MRRCHHKWHGMNRVGEIKHYLDITEMDFPNSLHLIGMEIS